MTITLDESILRRARVAAARQGLSLSALLRRELERIAERDERYEVAHNAALAWMEDGACLGIGEKPSRDDLHDRDALR